MLLRLQRKPLAKQEQEPQELRQLVLLVLQEQEPQWLQQLGSVLPDQLALGSVPQAFLPLVPPF